MALQSMTGKGLYKLRQWVGKHKYLVRTNRTKQVRNHGIHFFNWSSVHVKCHCFFLTMSVFTWIHSIEILTGKYMNNSIRFLYLFTAQMTKKYGKWKKIVMLSFTHSRISTGLLDFSTSSQCSGDSDLNRCHAFHVSPSISLISNMLKFVLM